MQIATLPIDTAKVRLQLLRRSAEAGLSNASAAAAPALGMLGAMRNIVADEGYLALYKGFWPAIQRQLVFASLRIGLYKQISEMFRKPGESTVSLGTKIISGLVSGGIGITIANPTDLVKVRMQSEGRLLPGQKPRYSGVIDAYRTIVRTEGVAGLWTGLGPAVLRNSIINATELASYETAKEFFLHNAGMKDGLSVHFLSGACAGLMATIIGNPVDVVKTRVMAARKAAQTVAAGEAAAAAAPQYTSALDCVVKTLRNEGPGAFYQGVVPQFYRLTGWSIVMFITFEQAKKYAAETLGSKKEKEGR